MEIETRRIERLVLLCTPDEIIRFEAFRKDQQIPTRSELMRHLIFSPIEDWEEREGAHAVSAERK